MSDSAAIEDQSAFSAARAGEDGVRRIAGDPFVFVRGALQRFAARMPAYFWGHQEDAGRALADHFGAGGTSGIVVIPPAGGKTDLFLSILDAMRGPGPRGEERPATIVLLPTRQLISQTIRRAHADFDLSIGAWSASHGRRPKLITAMSYDAFAEMTLDGRLRPEDVDLIVMDEAHRALSELRQDVFGRYLDTTAVMAFTATPAFDAEKALHVLLGEENEVYKADPHELRAEGVLAPFVNLVLDVTLEGDIPSDPDEWRRVRRQAIVDAVVDLVATYVPPETGVPLKDWPGLYYCSDIDQTRQLSETYNAMLGAEERRMETVSGDDELWRVEAALEELARGDVSGIANCRLLEEGTNVPDVKLVMTMPTLSAVRAVQQGGRCMRVLPELAHSDPRQVAFVIEPVLTINGRREKRVHLYQVWGAETDVQLARAPARRITEVTPAPRSEAGAGAAVSPARTVGGPITITSEIGLVQTFLYGEDLLPKAGDGDLSRRVLADRLGVSTGHGVIVAAWAAIEEQRAAGATEGTVEVGGVAVPWRLMRKRGGQTVPTIPASAVEILRAVLGDAPKAGDGDLSRTALVDRLGVSLGHGVIVAAWATIEEQRATGATEGTVQVGDTAVPWRLMRDSMGRTVPTVPESAVEAFRAVLGDAPKAGDGDLSRNALADRLGVSAGHGVIVSAWAAIEEQRAAGATEGTVQVGDTAVPWRLMRIRGGQTVSTVPASSVEAFRAVLDGAPIAGEDNLHRHALADRLGVSVGHGVIAAAWAAIEEQRAAGATEGTVQVGDTAVPWRLARSGTGLAVPTVPASAVEILRAVLGDAPKAGDGDLSRTALVDRLGVSLGHGFIAAAWATIEEQRAAGATEGTVQVGDVAVPWRLMRVGPGTSPTVPASSVDDFRAVLGDAPKAGDGDLSRRVLADRLGVSAGHGFIAAAWAAIEEQRAAGATEGTVQVGDTAVPWRLARNGTGLAVPTIPASAVEILRAVLGDAPKAGDGDFSRRVLADRLGVDRGHVVLASAWAVIEEQRAAGATEGTVQVGDVAVPWRLMRPKKGQVVPFVPASAVEAFGAALDGAFAPEPQRSADDADDPSPDMGM